MAKVTSIPKKTIPHPKEINNDDDVGFRHVIEQYQAGHIGFRLLAEPENKGGPENAVVYLVERYDINPDEPAEHHGLTVGKD